MMSEPQANSSREKAQVWDNEGGSIAPEHLAGSLGVVRHMTETYSVGGFRYTNLDDAIAQARRMTELERELLL
ncbi:hypothetical protein G7A66_02415 [Altererythrobacter sp. SALINAS58]|uniref:hypothetical protein n=1 Tax=Alteripontixanthobacter muriae TaxID=2705546 RepID=UPI00157755E6|nr:hypothetical protein [Alteripontixanthobacter muriae]NTZ41964.1 hypothetical protein [Alteripontixanthobacter muriae]